MYPELIAAIRRQLASLIANRSRSPIPPRLYVHTRAVRPSSLRHCQLHYGMSNPSVAGESVPAMRSINYRSTVSRRPAENPRPVINKHEERTFLSRTYKRGARARRGRGGGGFRCALEVIRGK